MSQQNDIHEVEMSIAAAKEMVERGEMAAKLADNPAFKKIVLDGYFVDEAARLAHLYSDPNMSAEQRGMIKRDLAGIGGFKRYLQTLVRMGQMADDEIREAQFELDAIRAEGDDE